MFTWFNDSKATRNYCIFGKKKLKSSTKQVVMRLLFCAIFWKAIYEYYARFWFRKEIHNQSPSLETLDSWPCSLQVQPKSKWTQTPSLDNLSIFQTKSVQLFNSLSSCRSVYTAGRNH